MTRVIVTLLSDFGLKDPYVAEMKAVILSECAETELVDISHKIDKFDVRMGAFVLASAAPYFPKGTVHVAVVDPGVGTKRRSIIVETKRSYFVGPDNGVLFLAALKEDICHVYVIENSRYMLPKVSNTFHGRDIFAPAAVYLAKGCAASEFGREVEDYVVPDFANPHSEANVLFGEVLYVDDFGNIVTNIPSVLLKDLAIQEHGSFNLEICEVPTTLRFCSAYGEAHLGEVLAIVGSHDFLEISVNQGNAAKRFKAKSGDSIRVWR